MFTHHVWLSLLLLLCSPVIVHFGRDRIIKHVILMELCFCPRVDTEAYASQLTPCSRVGGSLSASVHLASHPTTPNQKVFSHHQLHAVFIVTLSHNKQALKVAQLPNPTSAAGYLPTSAAEYMKLSMRRLPPVLSFWRARPAVVQCLEHSQILALSLASILRHQTLLTFWGSSEGAGDRPPRISP